MEPDIGACADPGTVTISWNQPLPAAIEEVERARIIRALSAPDGRLPTAAARLRVSHKGLPLKQRRLHIDERAARD